MSYAAQADLIKKFGERELVLLTDRGDEPTGEIVAAVIDEALADTDAEINAYLTRRYSLPLDPVPRLVLNLACDIARYKLHTDHAPEEVEKRYKAAVATLRDLASGKASLGDDDASAEVPQDGGGPSVDAPPRVFDRDTMKDF